MGTATVLLRYAGFTILTDPNFLHSGDHVHPGYGLQSVRLTNPAIELDALPPIDLLILSHMHEDHFDRVVVEKLNKATPIYTTHHAAADLQSKGFSATHALNTWETAQIVKGDATLRITSMPGKHGPGVLAAALPPVMGSMLEFLGPTGATLFRLYISGDTLIHNDLEEIPRRYPDIDLALLHLGGTRIFGIMLTMNGEKGVQAIQLIGPRMSIPIHFNDYEVFKSPLQDFMAAVTAAGLEERVHYLAHGETYDFHVDQSRRQAPPAASAR